MDNNITIYKNFISFDSEIKALKYVENALLLINTSKEIKQGNYFYRQV